MSRRELEGVLAHELSHIRNRDVQVTTLAVTTVGILVVVADISARASFFSDWGDDDNNDGGALVLIAIAILAGILAFGARLLSFAISRHREELADTSAVAIVSPDGLRRALEKLEADHTVVHHVSRATAHLWIEAPLQKEGNERQAKANRLFDTHPPIAERIAILRKLEGLDPERTRAGRPDEHRRARRPREARRVGRAPGAAAAVDARLTERRRGPSQPPRRGRGQTPGWVSKDTVAPPVGKPPGWYHVDEQTLRYWQGVSWTMWFATWNGKRWVQTSRKRLSALTRVR